MQVFLILTGLAIDMVILRHYRINFMYLMKMDPGITLQAVEIFRVKIDNNINYTKKIYFIFLECFISTHNLGAYTYKL
jgi:hypothetical protein